MCCVCWCACCLARWFCCRDCSWSHVAQVTGQDCCLPLCKHLPGAWRRGFCLPSGCCGGALLWAGCGWPSGGVAGSCRRCRYRCMPWAVCPAVATLLIANVAQKALKKNRAPLSAVVLLRDAILDAPLWWWPPEWSASCREAGLSGALGAGAAEPRTSAWWRLQRAVGGGTTRATVHYSMLYAARLLDSSIYVLQFHIAVCLSVTPIRSK